MTTNQDNTMSSRKRKPVKHQDDQRYLGYSILVRQEGDQYASLCPELDVTSSGATVEEATANLKDAVTCYLDTYVELGELSLMIKERGLKLTKNNETSQPVFLSGSRISIPYDPDEDAILVST
jgi:predicted RNase H-like HicB family nuclease